MDAEVAITQLRWTRSDPPERASLEQRRREVYCAALQQFEELLHSARVAGPASRPLPLFYAVSQAGRAIVAAHGDDAETYGHGLAELRDEGESTQLLHRKLRRRPSRDGHDTFGAVARATRSGDFDGEVELGALWVANPHAPRLPLEHWLPTWRLALLVVDEDAKAPSGVQLHEHARLLRVLPFADPLRRPPSMAWMLDPSDIQLFQTTPAVPSCPTSHLWARAGKGTSCGGLTSRHLTKSLRGSRSATVAFCFRASPARQSSSRRSCSGGCCCTGSRCSRATTRSCGSEHSMSIVLLPPSESSS